MNVALINPQQPIHLDIEHQAGMAVHSVISSIDGAKGFAENSAYRKMLLSQSLNDLRKAWRELGELIVQLHGV